MTEASSSLPISAYLLPSERSSSTPITITIPDSDQDDDEQSTPPPPPRKMTAAMRKQRDRAAAAAAAAAAAVHRTSSSSITINDPDSDDEIDRLPLTVLMSRWAQQSSQSNTAAVLRRAMSDITNVVTVNTRPPERWQQLYHEKKSFYQRIRAELAHPDDDSM